MYTCECRKECYDSIEICGIIQGDRTKKVGVVDSEYIVHKGIQTLGGHGPPGRKVILLAFFSQGKKKKRTGITVIFLLGVFCPHAYYFLLLISSCSLSV